MDSLDQRTSEQPGLVVLERLADAEAHLHATTVDDRAIQLLAQERERRTIELPPLGTLVRAVLWFIVPAVPLGSLVDWEAAALGGAVGLVLWMLNRLAARSSVQFADGFLRFRDEAPAHGIREDDDVRWQWSRG
jgi:hypothetical protein